MHLKAAFGQVAGETEGSLNRNASSRRKKVRNKKESAFRHKLKTESVRADCAGLTPRRPFGYLIVGRERILTENPRRWV